MAFNSKPHSKDEIDARRLVNEETPFAINEAFRSLCTKVMYLPIADKCRKIAVTSAISGEGKTYISMNLALTLANNSHDKKILLVDLDMRRPRVSRIMMNYYNKVAEKGGLSEFLAGIDKEPNIIETDIPNLSILFSGKESSNPIGLLNSAKMVELLNMLSEKYDYIIFDTPPVSLVSDAVVISDKINGYILSTRANYSNINHISTAVDTITNVNGTILGFVLTSMNPKSALPYGGKSYQTANYYSQKG